MRTRSRSSRWAIIPTSMISSPSRSASRTAKPVSSFAKRRRRIATSPSNGAPGTLFHLAQGRQRSRRRGGSDAAGGAPASSMAAWIRSASSTSKNDQSGRAGPRTTPFERLRAPIASSCSSTLRTISSRCPGGRRRRARSRARRAADVREPHDTFEVAVGEDPRRHPQPKTGGVGDPAAAAALGQRAVHDPEQPAARRRLRVAGLLQRGREHLGGEVGARLAPARAMQQQREHGAEEAAVERRERVRASRRRGEQLLVGRDPPGVPHAPYFSGGSIL